MVTLCAFSASNPCRIPTAHANRHKRRSAASGGWRGVALPLAVALAPNPVSAQDPLELTSLSARRRVAVQAARAGNLAQATKTLAALANLSALPRRRPQQVSRQVRDVIRDLVVVLHWASRDKQAVEVADNYLQLPNSPVFVLRAVANATRNLGRHAKAAALYSQALAMAPDDLDLKLGLALTSCDRGKHAQCRALVAEIASAPAASLPVVLGAARLARRTKDWFVALRLYDRALSLAPDHRDAYCRRVQTILDIGAVQPAVRAASQHPSWLPASIHTRLVARTAAQRLRHGRIALNAGPLPTNLKRRIAQYHATSATKHLALLDASPDRVVAHALGGRHDQAIAEFERLYPQAEQAPPYLLVEAARSYAAEQRSDRANELFLLALHRPLDPSDRRAAQIDLLYSLSDANRYTEAQTYARRFLDRNALERDPIRRGAKGANPWHTHSLMVTLALLSAFDADLDGSESQLQRWTRTAPGNPELRAALGDVLLWSAKPRRAVEEYEIALSLDPEGTWLQAGYASALVAAGRLDEARPVIDGLSESSSAAPHVHRLLEEWQLHNGSSLDFTAKIERGTGGPARGNGSYRAGLRLHGPNHRDLLRPVFTVEDRRMWAHRQGAVYGRIGAGMKLLHPDTDLTGLATYDLRLRSGTGGVLTWTWRPTDNIHIETTAQYRSTEVPMQARQEGIGGHSASAGFGYQLDRRSHLSLGLSGLQFDDKNLRLESFAGLNRSLHRSARFDVTAAFELYCARNNRGGRPYYNPRNAVSGLVSVAGEWAQVRRYAHRLTHSLYVGVGPSWQQDYGHSPTAFARYALSWSPGLAFGFSAGVQVAHAVYDATTERSLVVELATWTRF